MKNKTNWIFQSARIFTAEACEVKLNKPKLKKKLELITLQGNTVTKWCSYKTSQPLQSS
jgi:hypothetical protein